jgi:hypothetical protein
MMNSDRSCGIPWRWAIFLAAASAVAACSGGKFSSEFAQEIASDCAQTYACQHTSDVETCIKMESETLDTAPVTQQQFFVDTVSRCEASVGCDYTNCTFTNVVAGSYSGTHMTQITFDCQQSSACRIMGGQTVSNDAVNSCISEKSATLDANPLAASQFDAKFQKCNGFVSCSWTGCQ